MRRVRRPYTWKERVVDRAVLWINQFTGQTHELSEPVRQKPYPKTLSQELDVLASLHRALATFKHDKRETLCVEMTRQTIRPEIGSRLTSPSESFILPNKIARVYAIMSGEIRDPIPLREDKPNDYDFRHCPVTMRAWKEIKAVMPPSGTTIVTTMKDGEVQGSFFIGPYTIFRGKIEYAPNRLYVTIK